MIAQTTNNFATDLAWTTLTLLVQRKALLHPSGVAFYVWQRGERIVIGFDPAAIELSRVNDDFTHTLSTRLHGRRVVKTNSRGLFLQVGIEIPRAQMPLETRLLDLSQQPSPWHVPVGMTREGPLWVSLLDGDSFLIGGSRGGGKTGEEHAWIQALLHGSKTLVYAWDGKRGAEFGRYMGRDNFKLLFTGIDGLQELHALLKERETLLATSGHPNIIMYNEANPSVMMLPIALVVDEAADLPETAKDLLKQMIRLYRHAGLYPIIATNQPTQAEVFAKTNLSTRVAFRVPHHNDSVTMLGYKGAETLPDITGRGLIVWRGKFVDFQSFEVTYPMPSPAILQAIGDQLKAVSEQAPGVGDIERMAESIRSQWQPGMSKRATSKLLGKEYAGNAWTSKVNQIYAYLTATTTTDAPPGRLEVAPA